MENRTKGWDELPVLPEFEKEYTELMAVHEMYKDGLSDMPGTYADIAMRGIAFDSIIRANALRGRSYRLRQNLNELYDKRNGLINKFGGELKGC